MPLTASDFPDGFAWGAATASYQIEGAVNEGGRGPSIWDTFTHAEGNTEDGDTGDVATDHYHRYREDVSLMSEIGVNSYRFSIAWSRLLPQGTGEVSQQGIDFYRSLCTELLDKGITPHATLYHWDLPQALQDRGGWANPDSVEWFVEYARVAKDALGDLIHNWATFNEPHCTAFIGHSAGRHAPGVEDPAEAYLVAHHLMLAHHGGIAAMRETSPDEADKLGIVLNLIPAWPNDASDESKQAAEGVDAIHNRLFAAAVLDGKYPGTVLRYMAEFGIIDRIDTEALAAAKQSIDFLGVNYYNINHIAHEPGAPLLSLWPGPKDAVVATPPGSLTEMNWGVEPVGLQWMLGRIKDWAPNMPLMIMENGAAYPDVVAADGAIHDTDRIQYLKDHIEIVHDSIATGSNVTGYFVWSLMDNLEWARGFSKRFGLIRVDFDTLERTIKDSGYWYQGFLSASTPQGTP